MRVLMILIVFAVIVVIALGLWRARREQLRQGRRAAWHARRAEEDRIWRERMDDGSPGG